MLSRRAPDVDASSRGVAIPAASECLNLLGTLDLRTSPIDECRGLRDAPIDLAGGGNTGIVSQRSRMSPDARDFGEFVQQGFRVGDPTELRLDDVQRRLVIGSHPRPADRLRGAILKDEAPIVAEDGIPDGRLDADTRRPSDKDEVRDAARPEDLVEVCFEERAVAVLRDDEVTGARRKLSHDVCISMCLR